jgi:hypothetical protein
MLAIARSGYLTLVAALIGTTASSLRAQYSGAKKAGVELAATAKPCTLLTDDEINKYIARGQTVRSGDAFTLAGGAGSGCEWGAARGNIIIYSGPNAEEGLNAFLKAFNHDKDAKRPVSGVGDRAWVIFLEPRNQYSARSGFLGVKTGQYMVGMSLEADAGKPIESVEPDLIPLGKLVVSKLR